MYTKIHGGHSKYMAENPHTWLGTQIHGRESKYMAAFPAGGQNFLPELASAAPALKRPCPYEGPNISEFGSS